MKRKLNDNDVPEPVEMEGNGNVPSPKPTFGTFGLDARLLQAVNREKFSTPTAVQVKAVPLALGGKDVLGKTERLH